MKRTGARPGPKLLAVSVALCFALDAGPLGANPTVPSVAHGSVGFNGLGTSALTITNQAGGNAVINWSGFSIGVNELTRFQQFQNLAVLNRVTGGDVSSILGALQSDGRVFLINPNGIVLGASARIDTAGLVASSLALSDQDFLGGRLRFTEVPGAGAVVNNGVIETAAGGRVYLVAPSVENNGLITSPQGAIVLAAGKEVELVDAASPFVTVKVAAAEEAVNVGKLVAEGGQIGMFGALVRNSGVVEAGGAVAGPGGGIRLVAAQDLTLDAGSVVSANGTSGGKVQLQAEGGTNLVGGTVEAQGSSGTGGEVSALGVRVGVVGHGVIDVSGEAGGGTVLVGGDYQGNNAAVQNAERTYIGADGVIRADAMSVGDGGRVIVWADGDTRFYGSISAKGGSEGGNGGFVETSGREVLQVSGIVSTAAPNGQSGTWLLDPGNLIIEANNSGPDDAQVVQTGSIAFADPFGGGSGSATVGVGSINAGLLVNGTVVLQAVADIVLDTDVNLTNGGNLTLQAGNDISMGTFSISLLGNLSMTANHPAAGLDTNMAAGSITASAGGGNITTNGGDFFASGVGVTLGDIDAKGGAPGGGNVILTASAANLVTGSIATNTATVDLSALNGAIVVNGDIDTRGADGFNVGQGQNGSVYSGRSGGNVTLSAASATIDGSILTGGGDGLDSPSTNSSNDRTGGDGGNVAATLSGDFAVTGAIDASGGNGGAAGNASAGTGGGSGGSVNIAANGIVDIGSIASRGGSGGPGTGVGGDGGNGGTATLSSLAGVTIASLDLTGGNGGAGGSSATDASGGDGGNGGAARIYGSSITTGSIAAQGGDGGNGGTLTNAAGSSDGGAGGAGGSVELDTTGRQSRSVLLTEQLVLADQLLLVEPPSGFSGSPIATGGIDVSGGNGGLSGAVGSASSTGGAGGAGGDLLLVGSTIDVGGPILARGGDGGASVNASLGGSGTPSGGDGGDGGDVGVYGAGVVRLNLGGALGALALDVSGGAGGAGNPATSPAGDGGDGGDGGSAYVLGTPDIQIFGSMDASGGAGGAGGEGTGAMPGGLAGAGGAGGTLYLDASSLTGSQTGDGFIYVLASTVFDVSGGPSGTFERNSDYFGTIVGLDALPVDPLPGDPLLSEEINSGFQQIVGGAQETVAFVGGEKAEEEEDKSQKELGSCKG